MPNLEFFKTPGGLLPADVETDEIYIKFGLGEIVGLKYDIDRNPKHSAKYWSILTRCVKLGITKYDLGFTTKHQLHFAIMCALGIGEWIKVPKKDGTIDLRFQPDSVKFEKKGQIDFDDQVYTPAMELLKDWYDCTMDDLEAY